MQLLFLLAFLVDSRLPVLGTAAVVVAVVLLDNPIWSVGLMLAARLLSTGTMSFFSIGRINIGLFEPVLLFALVALGLRAVLSQKQLWRTWPWQLPFGLVIAWNSLGLLWCVKVSDGFKDIITLGVITATSLIVLSFLETWEQVKLMLWFWIGTCVLIGLLALFGDSLGLTSFASQWQAASQGGRETGLGQQPNWFSMNLMFVVHATAAFALIQRQIVVRYGLLFAAIFIFFAQMTSGSRGGAYSIVIGGMLVSLGLPLIRKWMFRFVGVGGLIFAVAAFGNLGDIGKGLNRIANNVDVLFTRDIRGMNWAACVQMLVDSNYVGIGPGGYIEMLEKYNWWLYQSVYRYPHGIFWGELAHGGIVGVGLLFFLVVQITRMSIQTIRDCRGTEAEPLAWAMPASMAGYFAWSFVEFSLDEKPFWEWLAVYTALHLIARKAAEGKGPAIPPWQGSTG